MKNPLAKSNMFATPKTPADLYAYVEGMSGSERAIAYTVIGMTMNLATDLVDRAIAEEDAS
tara:strand:+ start:2112 stop:2294 length:183 start_codon:yes stop_codon:yes gene_type:complete